MLQEFEAHHLSGATKNQDLHPSGVFSLKYLAVHPFPFILSLKHSFNNPTVESYIDFTSIAL
jgi:hypothetical protein